MDNLVRIAAFLVGCLDVLLGVICLGAGLYGTWVDSEDKIGNLLLSLLALPPIIVGGLLLGWW